MSLLDILEHTKITKRAIDKSLALLCKRGFLSRKKVLNENYTGTVQKKKQFLYNLTEQGKWLIQSKLS
ncbi:MAG: hypothetical protein ACFE8B_12970 [Candidatus Hermodarchaeota archaeon]